MKKENKGLRFNDNKVRHDLLEPHAINEVAKVFTYGDKKYNPDGTNPHNWLKGMAWSKMIASGKRHINAMERGEDYDFDPNCPDCKSGNFCKSHSGLLHAALAAWNFLGLVSYYKYHPKLDDRFKVTDIPRIGLDIDEVLANFTKQYDKHYKTGIPSSWNFDKEMPNRLKKHAKDKKFWMDIEPHISGHDIPFEPVVYITARPVDSSITEAWLKKHNFPVAPIVTVKPTESKLDVVKKYNLDIFVDDNYKTFCSINNNSDTLCLLFAASHNKRHKAQAGHMYINSLSEVLKTF